MSMSTITVTNPLDETYAVAINRWTGKGYPHYVNIKSNNSESWQRDLVNAHGFIVALKHPTHYQEAYYLDSFENLVISGTGVLCYQHNLFPLRKLWGFTRHHHDEPAPR